MIVVDSSVWIDHLNDVETGQVFALRRMIRGDILGPILVGELILFEVLAGLRDQNAVARVRPMFDAYLLVSMLDFDLVPRAVANYQALRRRGITMGTVDMIIGTYCIEMSGELLTADRDFLPMRDHLGLRLVA
jgi:predicted nucleic acid-binding protein